MDLRIRLLRAGSQDPGEIRRLIATDDNRVFSLLVTVCSIVLLLSCTLWQIFDPESMEHWAREDGPFEYATALLYGLAAIFFGILAKRSAFPYTKTRGWGYVFLLVWLFGTFFIMGEEISWGQRIVGFETPENIKALNYQDELTVHNLQFVYDKFTNSQTAIFHANALSLVMVLVGVVFPAVALSAWGRQLIQRFSFPVVPGCYSILFIGGFVYGRYLTDFAVDPQYAPYEVREFIWSLGVFLFAIHGFFRPYDLYRTRPPERLGMTAK